MAGSWLCILVGPISLHDRQPSDISATVLLLPRGTWGGPPAPPAPASPVIAWNGRIAPVANERLPRVSVWRSASPPSCYSGLHTTPPVVLLLLPVLLLPLPRPMLALATRSATVASIP